MNADEILRLASAVVAGSVQAAARLLTLIENDGEDAAVALRALFPHTGRAHVVGITGPPGSGKSTLVNGAIRALRAQGRRVGVIAVDPSSPFTGGALLGDRIRMQDHSTDPEVFVRSMATRGSLGGLAPATGEAVAVLDAWGAATVFVETVGTGQAEVDVVSAADTVVVVSAPGLGDGVQALKAGVMEIGDVFVVNKADRPEADRAVNDLRMVLAMAPEGAWRPPVLPTVATTGEGVAEVLGAVSSHARYLEQSGALAARRKARWRREVVRAVEARLRAQTMGGAAVASLDELVELVASGQLDTRGAALRLLDAGRDAAGGAASGSVRVDHIGVAVRSITEAARFYREALGLRGGPSEQLPAQGVTMVFFAAGGTRIELLEPLTSEGPIARFLERRGEGVHHVALVVPDVALALEGARAAGFEPVDATPRPGAHGTRVVFLHPKGTHGVLVELVEPAPRVAPLPEER
ncbi:MAG: methylmalonyl Co-A mutase-associated GTPase MeaB [bacterium]|nr:methylmalonyl Co-A mutase-associated GTPase MeaB [bacterium]